MNKKIAFAIVAHPDDVEFRIAGTLMLLKQAGYEIHSMNIANGSLGSVQYNTAQTIKIRGEEVKRAAAVLGAHYHPPLVNDLEIFYDLKVLKRLSAVVREVQPNIILTHPPQDYMEDHVNAGRLAVSAAFVRGMPNLKTLPATKPYDGEITVYHCLSHGFCDTIQRPMIPQFFVNTTSVFDAKCKALAQHESQAHWLEVSQGMNAYVRTMVEESQQIGKMSRKFKHAEGWWRHLHLGFCGADTDPLREALGKNYAPNPAWKKLIQKGIAQ